MERWQRRLLPDLPLRSVLAAVYLAVAFFAVTKGPVFHLRLRRGPLDGDFIDDRFVQLVFCTLYVVGILAFRAEARAIARRPLALVAIVAIPAALSISTLWSVAPARTFEQSSMMVLGTIAVAFAAHATTVGGAFAALLVSHQVGAVLSRIAVREAWPLATGNLGHWNGIYFNRNSHGAVVTVAALVSGIAIVVIVDRLRRRPPRERGRLWVAVVVLALFVGLDAQLIAHSGSLTPAAGSISTLLVGAGVLAAGRRVRGRKGDALGLGVVVGLGVAWQVALSLRDGLAQRLGRSPDLAGRAQIWETVRDFYGQRPVFGWGYLGLWDRPEVHAELLTKTYDVREAHTGFYEVIVAAGVVGWIALIAAIGASAVLAGRSAARNGGTQRLWALGVLAYVITVNFTETYIGPNLLPWTVLTAAVVQAARDTAADRFRSFEEVVDVGP